MVATMTWSTNENSYVPFVVITISLSDPILKNHTYTHIVQQIDVQLKNEYTHTQCTVSWSNKHTYIQYIYNTQFHTYQLWSQWVCKPKTSPQTLYVVNGCTSFRIK